MVLELSAKGRQLIEAMKPTGPRWADKKAALKEAFRRVRNAFGGLSVREAAERFSESFGSTWFPDITLDAINKEMIDGYGPEPMEFLTLTKQSTAKDFRTQYEIASGAFPDLDTVQAGGAYREVIIPDEKASWSLAKYGNLFSLDMETTIDDELGALMERVREWGESARRTTNNWFWVTMLEANPAIYDAVTLFHANHNNILTTTPLSEGGLRSAIAKLRRQTGRNGEKIHLNPKYLVVPPELADVATRLVKSPTLIMLDSAAASNQVTGSVNTIAGHGIEVISTPFLASNEDWYLFASRPSFKFGRFRGQPTGPQTFQEMPGTGAEFEQDRMRWKIRDFWGGAWIDFRGAVKGDAS